MSCELTDRKISKIIQNINENYDDMKESLIDNGGAELIPLFYDYTKEIIEIIKSEVRLSETPKD